MGNKQRSKPAVIVIICTTLFLAFIFIIQYGSPGKVHAVTSQEASRELSGVKNSDNGTESDGMLANCRYGITSDEITAHAIPRTGAGAFYKFNYPRWDGALPENDAELLHMIKTRQRKSAGVYLPGWYPEFVHLDEELAGFIRDDPGAVWIVGNEVERGPNPGEIWTARTGDMFPEVYAEAYHDIYHFIKGVDPTARVANAGLIQVTPMRLQYLDLMWAAYRDKYGEDMPVDVWTIHTYVLPELTPDGQPNNIASAALGTDLALGKRHSGGDSSKCLDDDVYCYAEHDDVSILEEQVLSMRQWMKEHGQKDKPLIVTEYGTIYHYIEREDGTCGGLHDEFYGCFEPERVTKFLLESFDYFNNEARDANLGLASDDNRLVQQWIWYGAWNWEIASSNLLDGWTSKTFTMMGKAYRDHVQVEPTYVNLVVDEVTSSVVSQMDDDTVKAKLSVKFRNNGNVAVEESFKVTFYSDESRTQPIGSTTIFPEVRGCATRAYEAEVEWSGLPLGTHPFWVKIDSGNRINEKPANKADNVGSGEVKATGPVYSLDIEIISDGIGTGGIVTMDPDEEAHEKGTVVTLTAIPYAGWNFDGWTGALVGSNPIAQITITEDTAVTAHFSQEQYKLEIKIVGDGEISAYPSPIKEHYVFGDYLELYAIPAEGWRFVRWSGDIKKRTPSVILTFESDISTTVKFEKMLDHVEDTVFMPVAARGG